MTSFEELYEKYATDVLRVSYFYLGDRQRAEDVCQDVFVRLMTNAPELEEGREKAWLLKVALNRCRDLWRGAWIKRVVLGSPVFETIPAPDDTQRRDDEEAMMKAIHQLPSAVREAILLYDYQGYGISEILGLKSDGTLVSALKKTDFYSQVPAEYRTGVYRLFDHYMQLSDGTIFSFTKRDSIGTYPLMDQILQIGPVSGSPVYVGIDITGKVHCLSHNVEDLPADSVAAWACTLTDVKTVWNN